MIFAEREEAPGIFQKNGPGERGGARCGSLFFYSHSCPHGGKALFPPRRSHSRHFHSCHAISMGGPSRSPPIGKPGLHRKTSRIESVFPSTKLLIIAYNDERVSVRLPGVSGRTARQRHCFYVSPTRHVFRERPRWEDGCTTEGEGHPPPVSWMEPVSFGGR